MAEVVFSDVFYFYFLYCVLGFCSHVASALPVQGVVVVVVVVAFVVIFARSQSCRLGLWSPSWLWTVGSCRAASPGRSSQPAGP